MAGGAPQADLHGDPTVTSAIASRCRRRRDGAWISCAGKPPWTLPDDQREDDARSLIYDWPSRRSSRSSDIRDFGVRSRRRMPVAYLSARLCDVFPDGTSALVTRGVLNLTHRESHSQPSRSKPGVRPDRARARGDVVDLRGGSSRAPLARGPDWPNTWPPPTAGTLEVDRGTVELELPVLEGPPVAAPPVFSPPPPPTKTRRAGHRAASARPPDRARHRGPPDARVTSMGLATTGPTTRRSTSATRAWWESPSDPGAAWAARNALLVGWPEADRATEAHSASAPTSAVLRRRRGRRLGRRARRYRPVERRFERTIPRRLQ